MQLLHLRLDTEIGICYWEMYVICTVTWTNWWNKQSSGAYFWSIACKFVQNTGGIWYLHLQHVPCAIATASSAPITASCVTAPLTWRGLEYEKRMRTRNSGGIALFIARYMRLRYLKGTSNTICLCFTCHSEHRVPTLSKVRVAAHLHGPVEANGLSVAGETTRSFCHFWRRLV